MAEPYLILHKVRGEPAFDIAVQIPCPICEPAKQGLDNGRDMLCNHGDWWIIPTSGHRAYPAEAWPLHSLLPAVNGSPEEMVADLPDHYRVQAAAKELSSKLDLSAILGIISGASPEFRRKGKW